MQKNAEEIDSSYQKGNAWKEAAWVFLGSRVLVLIATFVAVSNVSPGGLPIYDCRTQFYDCLSSWKFYDAMNFNFIAFHGYGYNLEWTAFFPLWPALMHMFAWLFGGSEAAVYFSSLFLTNGIFYLVLVLCYRLLVVDFDTTVSREALFYLAFAPYGIVFFASFSEALFLLLALAMFAVLRLSSSPGRWWLAGLCGYLASLTRSTGIVLLIPYAILLVQHIWPWRHELLARWRSVLNAVLPMVLIPAGILTYMLFLWLQFGDPLLFNTKQAEIWQRSLDWPWTGTVETIMTFVRGTGKFQRNVLDLSLTLIPVIALIAGWRRLPLHYSAFATVMMLFALCYPYVPDFPLGGGPRYMLIIFPVALLFGLWSKQSHLKMVFSTLSITAFVLVTCLFVRGISI